MKGIILAGGNGTRLRPMTKVTNKHLLPVYDKPMIFYPLQTLCDAGITDIMIITGKEHMGAIVGTLGSGKDFGCTFTYRVQDEAGGIAQALALAENFAHGDDIAVILGDNIFLTPRYEDDHLNECIERFRVRQRPFIGAGACVFLKEVSDPQRFGVAYLDGDEVLEIVEKPTKPLSSYAVTGLYLYDRTVFDFIRSLRPSNRGELEITDVNNAYIEAHRLGYQVLKDQWTDAGTVESLYRASQLAKEHYEKKK